VLSVVRAVGGEHEFRLVVQSLHDRISRRRNRKHLFTGPRADPARFDKIAGCTDARQWVTGSPA
jgi:hypothetical protein